MKSTQYFSFWKSPIGIKPKTCLATRCQIPLTTTAKCSSDSVDDQSSNHVKATCYPSKTAGSQPASLDLATPRPAGRDLAIPRSERLDSTGVMCSGISFWLDSGLLAVETWSGVSLESESAERGMDLVFLGLYYFCCNFCFFMNC
jgi:hypothetical protein